MKYHYSNLPIPGGGFVTGFSFHPTEPDLLYAKTDIGGTYKFHFSKNKFESISDHVTELDLSETYPLAIGLDSKHPNRLYLACGIKYSYQQNGFFCVSEDYGKTFQKYPLSFMVHGNAPGRGAGTRIAVDPLNSDIIYFASQTAGLQVSYDRGKHFSSLSLGESYQETDTIFVAALQNHRSDQPATTLIVSTAGITNGTYQNDQLVKRGHSLFISYDGGKNFEKLSYPSFHPDFSVQSKLPGRIGHRFDYDGHYFYVTLSSTGQYSYIINEGYSCDSGDATDGMIIRYEVFPDGTFGPYKDISPDHTTFTLKEGIKTDFSYLKRGQAYSCGFGGISSTPQVPGLLAASTLCAGGHGDAVFLSRDYGETWNVSLHNLEIGNMQFHTPYMKPEYNGNHSLLHWISDVKINPFNPNELFLNSGTGIFHTANLLSPEVTYSDFCNGVEETVHLNVYSPCKGDVCCIDILGDLGGFAFVDPHKPCENSFSDDQGNRYITCLNADFSDLDPNTVVVTPRGNWTRQTIGGLILSKDQCKTFTHLPLPYHISEKIDGLLDKIKEPNNNSGWVSISPDTNTIVWSIADWLSLPSDTVVVSHDRGQSFKRSLFYDLSGEELDSSCSIKTFSDRVDSTLFYGFSINSRLFMSTDSGDHFYECERPIQLPSMTLSDIDAENKCEIRGDSGKSGVFYLAMNVHGLWKLHFDQHTKTCKAIQLSQSNDSIYRVGLGIPSKEADYLNCTKTLYVNGVIDGVYGFYRSDDDGKTFLRINNDREMFGEILSIAGDAQIPGRFYLATGSRGLIMGEPL